jgi:hypothetical protein
MNDRSNKPENMTWHDYLQDHVDINDYPEYASEYAKYHDPAQDIASLLWCNLLTAAIPKIVVKVRTPKAVANKYPPYSFKLQCQITGRLSGFIAVKDYLKYGITDMFTKTGGPFPEPFDKSQFDAESKQVKEVYNDFMQRAYSVLGLLRQELGIDISWFEKYDEYLRSEDWQERRQQILSRDGRRCTKCNSSHYLQVHHLTYARVGDENLDDLVTLCRKCHEKEHGIGE